MFVEDEAGVPGYYDSESLSSGPPLEAVVTIPIHPGTGTGKGREKPSGYVVCRLRNMQNALRYARYVHAISANGSIQYIRYT